MGYCDVITRAWLPTGQMLRESLRLPKLAQRSLGPELCSECQTLDFESLLGEFEASIDGQQLKGPPYNKYYWMRELDEILDNYATCAFCEVVISTLRTDPGNKEILDNTVYRSEKPPFRVYFERKTKFRGFQDHRRDSYGIKNIYSVALQLQNVEGSVVPECRRLPRFQVVRDASPSDLTNQDHFYFGRRVASTVDFGLVQRWLYMCNSHKSKGKPSCVLDSSKRKLGVPKLVIDVDREMVVDAPIHCQYAALSYVWGGRGLQVMLTKETRRRLTSPGGLNSKWGDVPLTVSDAMLICHRLSIPYLWVDALCLDQGPRVLDHHSGQSLTQNMAAIYGSSYLTIVGAAGTNSWGGLPGLREGTRRGSRVSIVGPIHLAPEFMEAYFIAGSTWNKRGWTFQESYLSPRLLIFTDEQVYWSCMSSDFCEDVHLEHSVPYCAGDNEPYEKEIMELRESAQHIQRWSRGAQGHVSIPRAFSHFCNVLRDYSSRALSDPLDAIDAISGILSCLERPVCTKFHFGIPESMWEYAILFYTRGCDARSRLGRFPSWSWASWLHTSSLILLPNVNWSVDDADYFNALCTWYNFDRIEGDIAHFKVMDGIRVPGAYHRRQGHPSHYVCRIPVGVEPGHVLVVHTQCVKLWLGHDTGDRYPNLESESDPFLEELEYPKHPIYMLGADCQPQGNPIGVVRVHEGWRYPQGGMFEAFSVARLVAKSGDVGPCIFFMVIETDSRDMSTRVCIGTVGEPDWEQLKPKQQTLLLC